MSKRPVAPMSYAASLAVTPQEAPPSIGSPGGSPGEDAKPGQSRGRRPLEDAADPSVVYLHPAGKKSLRLYAAERNVKVHDLLLEAVEAWAAARGLPGPWRVPSAGPPRRRRD
jgi:hypothetical protein